MTKAEPEKTRARYTRRVRGPEVWARIEADVRAGMSYKAAAARWGVSVSTIIKRATAGGWRRCDLTIVEDATLVGEEFEAAAAELEAVGTEVLIRHAERAVLKALRLGHSADADNFARAARTLRSGLQRQAPEPDINAEAPDPTPAAPPWAAQAHQAQRPPPEPWRTWVFLGGRGAGKTRAGAEWLDAVAQEAGGRRLALVAPTLHDVREVMVDGESGLLHLPRAGRPKWEASRRRLRWPNGTTAQGFSAEDPESLRGPQFHAAWADEFCAWRDPGAVLPLLRMGLRLGGDPRLVLTTTPKPIGALRALLGEPGCGQTRAGTAANAGALPPAFLEGLEAIYGGTRLARQELEGLVVEGEGALWRAEELQRCRGPAPAVLDRVVVAVDPPATAGGDACGIVAAGRAGDRAYVLEDATVRGHSPLGWAERAAEVARRWGAACIVAESNQGGDMVRSTLALAGAPCAVRGVFASHSKRARAEPVAALYEQGRVSHCAPDLGALEEELMALGAEGGRAGGSPDRADALVWALTALMLEARAEPRIRRL